MSFFAISLKPPNCLVAKMPCCGLLVVNIIHRFRDSDNSVIWQKIILNNNKLSLENDIMNVHFNVNQIKIIVY